MSTNADLIGRKTTAKTHKGTALHNNGIKVNSVVSQIKHAGRGFRKFVTVDGEAIFKSKEWPYY